MVVAAIPYQKWVDALSDIPGLRPVLWDLTGDPPDPAIELVVPPYMSGSKGLTALAAVPRLRAVQLLTAGLVSFALMPALGEAVPEFSWLWAGGAIGLGLASAVIQLTMNWAQKSVSPTRATVIYAGEPVWGGIVGRLAGERLPGLALVGAALIVAGMLASEVKFKRRGKPAPGRT